MSRHVPSPIVTLSCPDGCGYTTTNKQGYAKRAVSLHRCSNWNQYAAAAAREAARDPERFDVSLPCPTEWCTFTTKPTSQMWAAKSLAQHNCTTYMELQARKARGAAKRAVARARRDCQCPRAKHEHGTFHAYRLDGCRCDPCTAAATTYAAGRRRAQALGQTQGRVDADVVRAHLARLAKQGATTAAIATAAGTTRDVLIKITRGRTHRDGTVSPPNRYVQHDLATRLLALTINDTRAVEQHRPTLGVARRLQACVAAGWTQTYLARQLDVSVERVTELIGMRTPTVTAETWNKVDALYRKHADTPPPVRTPEEAGARRHARAQAMLKGWAPAAAWDDIDNPRERAKGVAITHELAA